MFMLCSINCILYHCAAFIPVAKDVCRLPSFFSTLLFKKIDVHDSGLVTRWVFTYYNVYAIDVLADLPQCHDMFPHLGYKLYRWITFWMSCFCFRNAFVDYWMGNNLISADLPTRIFSILKQPENSYLTYVSMLFFFLWIWW